MNDSTHQELLQKFKDGCQALLDAVSGLSEQQLAASRAPGKWTVKEIVIHLADTEIAVAFRIRNILAVDRPPLQAFDQDLWAKGLDYQSQDLQNALKQFQALRESNALLLQSISAEDWQRAAVRSDSSEITLESLVTIYSNHVYKHIDQIRETLQAVR